MGKFVVALLSLVVGLVLGLAGGATIGFGGGTGLGIATGLSAGACSVVRAAQDEGLLTDEQVDQVFNRAVGNLRQFAEGETSDPVAGSAAECERILGQLAEAAAQ